MKHVYASRVVYLLAALIILAAVAFAWIRGG
jgi:hypothetical protein